MLNTFHNGTMKYIYPLLFVSALTIQGCAQVSSPTDNIVPPQTQDVSIQEANILLQQGKKQEAAQVYFRSANNYASPQKERIILQAAEIVASMGDVATTNHYLSRIPPATLTGENAGRAAYVKALLALQIKDPNAALRALPSNLNNLSPALRDKVQQIQKSAIAMGGTPPVNTAVNVQAPLIPNTVNKIAVLLPQSGSLGSVSQDIYQGMQTAKQTLGKPTDIKLYDVSAGAVAQYQKAVADGADIIVGPLDKEALSDLLAQPQLLSKPILSLNYLTSNTMIPGALYQFGLLPEDEARQVASFAVSRNQRNAIILAPNSSWGERLASAFGNAYQAQGGKVVSTEFYPDAPNGYVQNVQKAFANAGNQGAMVFLAASPSQARLMHPLIQAQAPKTPVYATSHIFSGRTEPAKDSDLDGIVYTEIPWVLESLQSNSLNASTYPRMYALGMDAFLIAQNLPNIARNPNTRVSGKTGNINLSGSRQVQRSLIFSTFANGLPHALGQ